MRPSIRNSFGGAAMAAAMALAAFAATTPAQAVVLKGEDGFHGGGFHGGRAFRGGGFGHAYGGYAGGYGHRHRGYGGGYGGWDGHSAYGGCASSLWMLNPGY